MQSSSQPNRPSTSKYVKIPTTPSKYADAIEDLIDQATPTKLHELKCRNILTSGQRNAEKLVLDASVSAISSDKVVKKSIVKQIKLKTPKGSKIHVAAVANVHRNTLNKTPSSNKTPSTKLVMKQLIRSYYEREDNVTIYPNKSKNATHPLMVLKFGGRQLYQRFLEDIAPQDKPVSFSLFWSLRPKHVKKQSAAKLMQCVCDICENVELLLNPIISSMRRHYIAIPDLLSTSSLSTRSAELALSTLCHPSIHKKSCLDRECEHCGLSKLIEQLQPWAYDMPGDEIRYFKWEIVPQNVRGRSINRLTKVKHTTSRPELIAQLCIQLRGFGRHVFYDKAQCQSYRACKELSDDQTAVIVVDFAENYTCLRQGEAQSAYYSRNQVTIHPMVVTINTSDGNSLRDSVIILSDDLDHDSSAVAVFVTILCGHLAIEYPQVKNLVFWSDGCAAQYKSRKPFWNICQNFSSNYNIEWNFYGSRHGKGAADGETGVIKSFLGRAVRDQQVVIDNANDVYNFLCSSDRHIVSGASRRHFYFANSNMLEKERRNMIEVKTLPGTRKLHQIKSGPYPNSVVYRDLSCFCVIKPCVHADNDWKVHKFLGESDLILFIMIIIINYFFR